MYRREYFIYLILFLIVLLLRCESAPPKKEYKIASIVPIHPYEFIFEKPSIKKANGQINIVFEGSFENDSALIYGTKHLYIKQILSTDETIGVAFSTILNYDQENKVTLKFNNYPSIQLDSLGYFNHIYASKKINSKTLLLEFSQAPRSYK